MPRPEGGFVGSPTLRPTPLTTCTSALMRECPSPARPGISPPSSGLAPPKVAPRLLGAAAQADAPPRELGSYSLALPPTLTDAGIACGTKDINPSINLANCRLLLEADSSVTASSESAADGAALALVAFSAQGWHSEGAAVAGGAAESAVACVLPAAGAFAGAFAGAASAGFAPPNASRSRRATGASTVDEADLTNSPCSLSRARTSLLVTPSSFANSCTRALPATTSPSLEATAVGRPRLGFSYDALSSPGLHGVLMSFRYLFLLPGGRASRNARPPRMCPVNR